MPEPFERDKLFGVDMNHVARLLPPVPPHQRLGVQVSQPSEAQGLHDPSDRGEGGSLGHDDSPEGAELVPEVQSVVELLRVKCPTLSAANTASIRKRGVTT